MQKNVKTIYTQTDIFWNCQSHGFFLFLGYKSCSEPQKQRCNSTPIGKHNGINEESCKKICDENEKCNYVFWNKGWYCALYEDCVMYQHSKGVGTVFAKKGLGLNCPGKISPFAVYDSIML